MTESASSASKPHWLLILNGKSAGDPGLRKAVRALRDEGIRIDVRVTWEGGDAARLARKAAEHGLGTVIAAGGDGTLNEVAGALAALDAEAAALPALGLVPMGTANDFARGAHIPLDSGEALRLVRTQPPVAMDMLKVSAGDDSRWCANLATGGFGTQVTVETDPELKKSLGGLAYVLTGLGKLGQAQPLSARVRGEDFAWEGDFVALGIGNGRQAGGGQILCPKALVDDGRIDLTIVPEASETGDFWSVLGTALSSGRAAALEQVGICTRQPWLELEADAPFTLNLDGEPMQARRFRIDAIPGRLRMHLPASSPFLGGAAG